MHRNRFIPFVVFLAAACASDAVVAPPAPIEAPAAPAYDFTFDPSLPTAQTDIPEFDSEFADIDLCDALDGLCGAPVCPGGETTGPDGQKKGSGWKISGCGNLSELRIVSGSVRLTGTLALGLGVEEGSIADVGCRDVTVTIPAIPAIPATPPLRNPLTGAIIIPGTPGYPGRAAQTFTRRVPADCSPLRPASVATPGSVLGLQALAQPRVEIELEMEAKGSGSVDLRFPVPYAAIGLPKKASIIPLAPSRNADPEDYLYRVNANVGVYIVLQGRLTETTTHFRIVGDVSSAMGYSWSPAAGWSGSFELGDASYTGSVQVESPDTVQLRYGWQPAIGFFIRPWPDSDYDVGVFNVRPRFQAEIGAWLFGYDENVFTFDALGTLKNDANNGFEGLLYGGYATYATDEAAPCDRDDFLLVDCIVQTVGSRDGSFTLPFSCCESDLYDQYGIGLFRFHAETTGEAIDQDPDGYVLTWQRANMTPEPWVDSVMTLRLGVADTAVFPDVSGAAEEYLPYNPFRVIGPTTCMKLYSDAILPVAGTGSVLAEFRRRGVGVPLYTKIVGCQALPGDYSLEVSDLAVNCTPVDANPRVVTLRPELSFASFGTSDPFSEVTDVPIEVYCRPLVGDLRVAATTTGRDLDRDGYTIEVDDGSSGVVAVDGSLTLPGIRVGPHQFELSGLAFNCAAAAPNPRSADIAFEQTTDATANVTCTSVYDALCAMVDAAAAAGDVSPRGAATGLCRLLDAAGASRDRGNTRAVSAQMAAFQRRIESQRGRGIAAGAADAILAAAAYIADSGYFVD